jgi:lactoylglutathione lyase
MFSKIDYAMVTVSDMDRAVKFYRDALGFTLRFQSEGWTEFETGGTTLALHGGGKPASPDARNTAEGPVAGTIALGFSVSNLDETVGKLKSRGVRFVMEPTLRAEERIKLAVCIDPDGTALSIAEPIKH